MVDVIGYYDAGREVDDEVPGGQVIGARGTGH